MGTYLFVAHDHIPPQCPPFKAPLRPEQEIKTFMKIPQKFEILIHNGLVDEVVCQLMSGKEADVYVVRSMGELRCAKVYKDADNRSFSRQAQYQEGRKV